MFGNTFTSIIKIDKKMTRCGGSRAAASIVGFRDLIQAICFVKSRSLLGGLACALHLA